MKISIAILALLAIAAHLILRFTVPTAAILDVPWQAVPLLIALALAHHVVVDLFVADSQRIRCRLAGRHIHRHSVILGEYLAGVLVVLMLSGGQSLEAYRRAQRLVRVAGSRQADAGAGPSPHRQRPGRCAARGVAVGDVLVIFPHETCPVDGTVVEGMAAWMNRI